MASRYYRAYFRTILLMATTVNPRMMHLRALVIDDLPAMRQNMRLQFGQIGVRQIDQAANADEAILLLRTHVYDVILCDYNLNRETNGQQLLEFLRTQSMLPPQTLFIMVTAETSYDMVAGAAEFQPDAYMVKPTTGGALHERLSRLLDRQTALELIIDKVADNDFAAVLVECDALLKVQPKWAVDVLKIKAGALQSLGRHDDARAVYESVLKLRADIPWAGLGAARCHFAAGSLDAAREAALAVLATKPQFVAAHDLLAQVAEETGNEQDALDALRRSYETVPSAYRGRRMAEVAYRVGDLAQAAQAYQNVLRHTRGSLTAQPGDLLALAQVHVDTAEPRKAVELLNTAPQQFAEKRGFSAMKAALRAQACHALGDSAGASDAYSQAVAGTNTDAAADLMLATAKAAFVCGHTEEGASFIARAVTSDHENPRLLSLARKVLHDTGNASRCDELVDGALASVGTALKEAHALMRAAKFDEAVAAVRNVMETLPDNTGVLFAAAQIHLLWMSQKGVTGDYLATVRDVMIRLDVLMPHNPRVAKMKRFMRETIERAPRATAA